MFEALLISIVDDDALARDGISDLVEILRVQSRYFQLGGELPSVWRNRGDDMPDH